VTDRAVIGVESSTEGVVDGGRDRPHETLLDVAGQRLDLLVRQARFPAAHRGAGPAFLDGVNDAFVAQFERRLRGSEIPRRRHQALGRVTPAVAVVAVANRAVFVVERAGVDFLGNGRGRR
jgi:hypothetical protein